MADPPPPPNARSNNEPREYDRVELVWPGKTTEVERVSLPFQTIERVNEVSRSADGQARLRDGTELPDWWPEGWRNKLIWGDNKYVLSSLLDEFAGKVDLIYIDPPFDSGDDFTYSVEIGDRMEEKRPSAFEERHFRDTWGKGHSSYLKMMTERLSLMRDLLSPDGSIFVHVDWHVAHYLRIVLDEIFGADQFRNEIIWWYYNKLKGPANQFARAHDNIFWYTKGARWYYEHQNEKREKPVQQLVREVDPDTGRLRNKRDIDGKVVYRTSTTRRVDSVWRLPMLQPADRTENTGYRTQKRQEIISRVLRAASGEGSLVADFFCGSGTMATAAEEVGRRWICVDVGRYAVHNARKRLLSLSDARPFEVSNLGWYERRLWQGSVAGEAIWEYYRFILDLYGSAQISGFTHLHGEKGGQMVSVGLADAPVTHAHLDAAAAECAAIGVRGLDVLGWEWEMGLNPKGRNEIAAAYEIDIHLLNIPREVMDQKAVDAGDIHFFELGIASVHAYLDGLEATLELDDFIPAVDDYMREKVGDAITRWSDWIDYWAVDWDYDGEVFTNSWQAYRTRKEPSLMLRSDPHQYPAPGDYQVIVKVIDIFGNDTTTELTVTVGE